MTVLIAGMPRSGSTFSFNVARAMLIARGSIHQEANDDAPDVVTRLCHHHLLSAIILVTKPTASLWRAIRWFTRNYARQGRTQQSPSDSS
jgi:hypothetical protein